MFSLMLESTLTERLPTVARLAREDHQKLDLAYQQALHTVFCNGRPGFTGDQSAGKHVAICDRPARDSVSEFLREVQELRPLIRPLSLWQ